MTVAHMEEPLSHSLVHDDQGMLRNLWIFNFLSVLERILLQNNLVKLFKFVSNNLLSHGIADTISVDDDVVWEFTVVVLSEG